MSKSCILIVLAAFAFSCGPQTAQLPEESPVEKREIDVIAYYTGDPAALEAETVHQLSQIIHSFSHLRGNKLALDDAQDSLAVSGLVALKQTNPDLKVLLSLGGWGGCETCSPVFATEEGRAEFAQSVKDLLQSFNADGIDLDWEYPAIAGYPGHAFMPEDRHNFTLLVRKLRETLGEGYEISFAAGGFEKFLRESIEWDSVMPLLDRVNIMSYDLVHGNSAMTGHHTPLFSTPQQKESADNAVRYLDSVGVPREKMVIGAAFYGRVWEEVPPINNGLYQPGKFKRSVPYNGREEFYAGNSGFVEYWDSIAQAPYRYNPELSLFATFDDSLSLSYKTRYAIEKGLGGIMFWQLANDTPRGGMLEDIHRARE